MHPSSFIATLAFAVAAMASPACKMPTYEPNPNPNPIPDTIPGPNSNPSPNQNPNTNPNPDLKPKPEQKPEPEQKPKPVQKPNPESSTSLAAGTNMGGTIYKYELDQCLKDFETQGACELKANYPNSNPNKLSLVALPSVEFDKAGKDKVCGKVISMTYNGKTQQALVADRNAGAKPSIDMCTDVWKEFGLEVAVGRLEGGIDWSIADA
ncbi:hypothetical protein MHUMG1_09832 [Metarhizium humberi]|uniref:Barwin-like endoglucanase n=1 Tax=Metarhizium humberi TaxID=2596975 RepID=A0A9P8M2M5_9HYPO|nr:hypothetical protein MHUMG1_09832 [Metarhizium humberi]